MRATIGTWVAVAAIAVLSSSCSSDPTIVDRDARQEFMAVARANLWPCGVVAFDCTIDVEPFRDRMNAIWRTVIAISSRDEAHEDLRRVNDAWVAWQECLLHLPTTTTAAGMPSSDQVCIDEGLTLRDDMVELYTTIGGVVPTAES